MHWEHSKSKEIAAYMKYVAFSVIIEIMVDYNEHICDEERRTKMDFTINKNSETPLYIQIKKQLRDMIINGELYDGFCMFSERKLADMLGVHRNTIIKVYADLKDEGYLDSQERKGYVVRCKVNSQVEVKNGLIWESLINEEYIMRSIVRKFDEHFRRKNVKFNFVGSLGYDTPCSSELVLGIIREFVEEKHDCGFAVTSMKGNEELRKAIVSFLKERGIYAKTSEIQIMHETFQTIEYLLNILAKPGDTIITCEPLTPDIYRVLLSNHMQVITVEMDKEGIRCDQMETLIQSYKPKLIYIEVDFHNPTGIEMSLERRRKLLEISYKYSIPIIEESVTKDIRFKGNFIPSLKALDQKNHVIYLQSFHYVLPSGIKISFCVADKSVTDALSYIMYNRIAAVSSVTQRVLKAYIEGGIYRKEVSRLSEEYNAKMEILCNKIDEFNEEKEVITYTRPMGGVNLWLRLSDKVKMKELNHLAYKYGIEYLRGNIFFIEGTKGENFIRLNLSNIDCDEIGMGIEKLLEIIAYCLQ